MKAKELNRKVTEAINAKDRDAFLQLLHPEVELKTPDGQMFKGPDAVAGFAWALVDGFADIQSTNGIVIS